MTQGKWTLIVEPEYHKNIDPLGDWDGTCCKDYCFKIYDSNWYQEEKMGGYRTEEEAREAGEKALRRMEERK